MHIQTCSGTELPAQWLTEWKGLIESSDQWRSPFWRPELITAMARIRPSIEVARLCDSQGTGYGFFSYENHRGVAVPAGGIANDLHGIVTDRGMSSSDLLHLLDKLGLRSFRFHHMPDDQTGFAEFGYFREASFWIDLSHGWEGYSQDLQERGSKLLKRARQRENRLSREHGAVRLIESRELSDLEMMNRWKSEACRKKGWSNLYECRFLKSLQYDLLQRNTGELQGRLLLLVAGQTPIAGLYLLRSSQAWHAWNVAYNPDFGNFSPGLIAFIRLLQSAEGLSIKSIDLSRGEERFKSEVSNRTSYVWEGSCGGSVVSNGLRRAWLNGKRSVGHSRWGMQARRLVRLARRVGLMLKGNKGFSTEPIG